jgi:uncharacterized protein (DUF1501 family)
MVVPFQERDYYNARPQIAISQPKKGDAQASIDLDGFFSLHPSLAEFKPIYDSGHLAIVHAVGSPNNTRSHFDAQDYMESAAPGNKAASDGWLNRLMQSGPPTGPSAFRAVALSRSMPRSLMGRAPALAMTGISEFGIRAGQASPQFEQDFQAIYAQTGGDKFQKASIEAFEAVKMLKKANPAQYQPTNGAAYPQSQFGQALLQIAQLIKADVGLEIAFADISGWDTHANQGASRGQMAGQLQEFSQGLAALYRDLGERMNDVVVLTMTEFGRTIRQNGSGGTDHGHASCMFLLGSPIKGGKVFGKWPGLAQEQLYEGRDLALTTDFRDVFAEVASRHIGTKDMAAIFPGYKPDPQRFLGLIRS